MRLVSFAHLEDGDDIIVSFFILGDVEVPGDGYTIMAQRCPKFDRLLPEWERRPRLSNEMEDDGTGDDEFLERVEYDRERKHLTMRGARSCYEMSLRKLDDDEIEDVLTGFTKLNFDKAFVMEFK